MGREEQLRRMIAQEAARLMYEEGVKEYRDAKRKAARRFGGQDRAPLGAHLPTNAEIHEQFRRLLALHEEQILPERLLRLRLLALRLMECLAPFEPRLVGSVLKGTATERSDIDLHLFADSLEEVESHLAERDIPFTTEIVSVRKDGEFRDFPHIYLDEEGVEVECSLYPRQDRHRVPRSSITGRPMERAGIAALRKLLGRGLAGAA